MPQVPTIDEVSAQPEQEQFAGIPTPPPGAYPGQVGATIEQVGSEIGRIAYEEQQKTHEVRAMEAETAYQNYLSDTVYDVNKGFSSIYGRSAVEQAPVFKAQINAKREEIANSLGSRYAQRLFNNNSLRTLRFAQDHVDAWAGTQRRTADDASYKLSLVSAAKKAAEYASSPIGYDHEAVDSLMKQTQENAYLRAAQLGYDEDTAHDYANKSLGVVADSLIGGLASPNNPNSDFAAEEFKRWGAYMSPKGQASIEGKIIATGVRKQAAKILQDADRVSADPRVEADDDGKVDVNSYEKMIQNAKDAQGKPLDDGQKAALRHEVEHQLVDLNKEYEARVKDTKGRIVAAGVKGHAFLIDRSESADDLEWMRVNAPLELAPLEEQSRRNGDYELRGTTRSTKLASQMALLNQKDRFLHMKDDDPAKFATQRQVDTLGLGMDPNDQQKLWSMIQREQKPDAVKLPGGSIRSQIIDKLDSIYEGQTRAKQHARRFLLNKATEMKFKDQGEFNNWLEAEFQQSGSWFKSYQVEKEIEQADSASRSAAPVPPAQGPDQKTVYLGKARKFQSDPLATKAQKDWADLIFKRYNEKP